MLLDAFSQFFDLFLSAVVTVPLNNALSLVYVVGNFILQLLFLGSDPGGGGLPLPG